MCGHAATVAHVGACGASSLLARALCGRAVAVARAGCMLRHYLRAWASSLLARRRVGVVVARACAAFTPTDLKGCGGVDGAVQGEVWTWQSGGGRGQRRAGQGADREERDRARTGKSGRGHRQEDREGSAKEEGQERMTYIAKIKRCPEEIGRAHV